MHKILVTGSAGFIGYFLADTLSKRPDTLVYCVDNMVRGQHDQYYEQLIARNNVVSIVADISSEAGIAALPDTIDTIYHLAALNGTQNFYERPFEVIKYSTTPTLLLLEKYGNVPTKPTRFVYAGSSEGYAATVNRFDWEVPTAEDVPLCIDDVMNPRWSYAVSKIHGEVTTAHACRQFGIPFTVIRYHNVYGPRMGDKHVVPDFIERMNRGIYELYGYDDTRSFLYINDAVAATIATAESTGLSNEIVNIGSEQEIRMQELGEKIMQLAQVTGKITLHPSPTGSVKRRVPTLEKLYAATTYRPQWSLEDGLNETLRFYTSPRYSEVGKS